MEKLTTKLQLLDLNVSKSEGIVAKGNVEKIKRHIQTLRTIVTETEKLKTDVEQLKIENGDSVEEISAWSDEIETKTDNADREILNLQHYLDDNARKQQRGKLALED